MKNHLLEHERETQETTVLSSEREREHVMHSRAMTRRSALKLMAATALGSTILSDQAEAQEASQKNIDELTKKLERKGWHFPERFDIKNEGQGLLYPGVMMPERGWGMEAVCLSAVYDYSSGTKLSKMQIAYPMMRNIGEQRSLGSQLQVFVDGEPFEVEQGVVHTKPNDNAFLVGVLEGLQGKHTVAVKHISYVMNAVEPLDERKNALAFSAAVDAHLAARKEFPYELPHVPTMTGGQPLTPNRELIKHSILWTQGKLSYASPPPTFRLHPDEIVKKGVCDCGGYASVMAALSGAAYVEGYLPERQSPHAFNFATIPNVGSFYVDAGEGLTPVAPQDRRMLIASVGGMNFIHEPERKTLRKTGIPALVKDGKKIGVEYKTKFPDFGTNFGFNAGYRSSMRRRDFPKLSTADNNGLFAKELQQRNADMDEERKLLFQELLHARASLYPEAQRLAKQ